MKAAMVMLLCLTVILATVAGNEESCEPGTTFKRGCNECSCTSSGRPACTKKACPPGILRPGRAARAVRECEPGSNFKRDCNDCFCTNEGVAACTKLDCNTQPLH